MNKLPVSVVSPVRNCVDGMVAHAAHLRTLAEVAAEVIVVDSDSTDGTLEVLKKELAGLDVTFLNHPPGLYQSWNFGLAAANQRYCTVATVGDPMPAHSLKRIVATMEEFSADVVISAPVMLQENGKPSPRRWPVHQIIQAAGITGPQLIDPAAWIIFTTGFYPGNMLSSSSGNLYSTKLMQQNPFSPAYAHGGDGIWALEMARKARWVVDPLVESYFCFHTPNPDRKPHTETQARTNTGTIRNLLTGYRDFLLESGIPEDLWETVIRGPDQIFEKSMTKIAYTAAYRPKWPRFLQPEASRLRKQQKAINKLLEIRQKRVLEFARTFLQWQGKRSS